MTRPEGSVGGGRSQGPGPWLRRRALVQVLVGAFVVLVVVVAGAETDRHLAAVEEFVGGLGMAGPFAYLALYVLLMSAFVPEVALAVLAGVLFGPWRGSAIVLTGALLGTMLQYALARWLLRERIVQAVRTRPALAAIQRVVLERELRLQVLLRLTPLNPALLSYLLGASGVRFGGFLLASLAHAPAYVVEVLVGHAGSHLARLADGAHPRGALARDASLLVGVVAGVLAVVVLAVAARRALQRAEAEVVHGGGPGREPQADGDA